MAQSNWHPDGFAAYAKSDYTYEDAEKLASLWSIPIVEAKQVLGHKILNDIQGLLPAGLDKPSQPGVDGLSPDWDPNGLTAFFKSDYTFDDAQLLSSLWNITIVEAKQALGHKVIYDIQDLLPKGLQNPKPQNDDATDKYFRAYVKSDYNYDDAELLASLWNIGVVEAKDAIGFKVLNGLEKNLPNKLRENDKVEQPHQFEPKAFQAYTNSNYSYDDAMLLASLWNLKIEEAKEVIGNKILNDDVHLLPEKVRGSHEEGSS